MSAMMLTLITAMAMDGSAAGKLAPAKLTLEPTRQQAALAYKEMASWGYHPSGERAAESAPMRPLLTGLDATLPAKMSDETTRRVLSIEPIGNGNAEKMLAQVVDFTSLDQPMFQADVVHVMAPTGDVQPFAAVAHQYDDQNDAISRLGIGGGARWTIAPWASFGTELLIFPANSEAADPITRLPDTRFVTRFEISF